MWTVGTYYSRDPYATVQVHLTMAVKQTRFTGVRSGVVVVVGKFKVVSNLVFLPSRVLADVAVLSQVEGDYRKTKARHTVA